jgi:3'(2'), 5'-bisphosphate nucleotidase
VAVVSDGTGMLAAELACARDLAQNAGELIMRLRRGELDIEMKPGDEPVTIADRKSSEMIVAGIAAKFPTDTIVSEEAPLGALVPERMWLIDPIDGTKDYIRGDEGFSVMIGLVVAGRPVLGVVYQPLHQRTFYASPGGAFVETADGTVAPLRVSDVATAGEARLVASKSHRSDDMERVKSTLGIDNELNIGSVGVKLSLISLGVRDLYVSPSTKTKAWDTCAPEAILVRAGGRITDLFGGPIDYARELRHPRGLVATNGRIHDEVTAKLSTLFAFMKDRRADLP